MIIYLKRKLNALYPVDSVELGKLHGLGDGVLKAKITKPRNVGHHRKYFSLLSLVMDNLPHELEPHFKSVEQLNTEMKLQAGYYEVHHTLGGKEVITPKSISFSKMDQIEFEAFYDKCLEVIAKYLLPNINKEEIRTQLLDF